MQLARQYRLHRPPLERRLPGQHLIEHAAERIHIGPSIQLRIAGGLLGAHVGGGAERQSRLGHLVIRRRRDRVSYAEIGDDGMAGREEDVSGLISRWTML